MGTFQWIVIGVLSALVVICYFKLAYSIDNKKFNSGILSLFGLTFITAMSIMLLVTTIEENNELQKQIKAKCPQYEKIENVYILKK